MYVPGKQQALTLHFKILPYIVMHLDCLLHFLLFPSLPDEEKTFVLARWQQVIGSCFAHVSLKRLRWERDKKRFPDYDIRPGVFP